jgi:hypothetical protein
MRRKHNIIYFLFALLHCDLAASQAFLLRLFYCSVQDWPVLALFPPARIEPA